ncbi:MAG: hypothetical protein Q4A18_04125 [Rikenellaceae bacterium]|nr:hypothetical protein [Rikenellaceae bacterium]
MKLSGRNLKRRLYGLKNLPDRVGRARYFRGHGVHSPFVYSIVREVFIVSELKNSDQQLFHALRSRNYVRRRAIELQNLYTHLGYKAFAIDSLDEECDLCILSESCSEEQTRAWVGEAAQSGKTVALLSPYIGRERQQFCQALIEAHHCTSVDNRGYILLFSDEKLPKQHYKL